jgi:hypothetical protein
VLVVAVIAASLYFIGQRIATDLGQQDWRALQLRPLGLVVSLALTLLCILAGGWAWQLILSGLGYGLPLRTCLRIHCLANLAKYVPGYAWQLMGKAYLTRQQGVPAAVVGVGLVLEMCGLLATALLAGLLFWPSRMTLPLLSGISSLHRLLLALALVLGLALTPALLGAWGRLAARRHWWGAASTARSSTLWYAFAVMLAAWCLFGLGLAASIAAVMPLTPAITQQAIHALAFSFVVSLLVVFVPGGIGVREGMLVLLLDGALSPGLAGLVAIASRLVLMVGEVLAAGLVMALVRGDDNASITHRGDAPSPPA